MSRKILNTKSRSKKKKKFWKHICYAVNFKILAIFQTILLILRIKAILNQGEKKIKRNYLKR